MKVMHLYMLKSNIIQQYYHLKHPYILIGIFILTLLLRIIFLGSKCFWADEGITWFIAIGEVTEDAPLSYPYIFGWPMKLFGWNEFAGRFPSVIAGFFSIPIIYLIGKSFFSRNHGLIAAFIACVSAFLIPVSQEMRIYSLLGLEILLALLFFLHILKTEKIEIGWWIGLLLIGIIGQYTHCFFIFLLGYFFIALLVIRNEHRWRKAALSAIIIIMVIIAFIPQLSESLSVTGDRKHVIADDFYHLGNNIYRTARSFFCFLFGDYLTNLPGTIAPYLRRNLFHFISAILMVCGWLVIAPAGLLNFIKYNKWDNFSSSAAKVILGMLILFTFLFIFFDVSSARHLIFAYVPFLFIFTSFWVYNFKPWKLYILIVFIALNLISLFSYYQSDYFADERADWRKAAELLKEKAGPDDAVLLLRERNAYYTLKFYHRDLGGDVYYIPHREADYQRNKMGKEWWLNTNMMGKVDFLLKNHDRVWVIESHLKGDGGGKLSADFKFEKWNFGPDLNVLLFTNQ